MKCKQKVNKEKAIRNQAIYKDNIANRQNGKQDARTTNSGELCNWDGELGLAGIKWR